MAFVGAGERDLMLRESDRTDRADRTDCTNCMDRTDIALHEVEPGSLADLLPWPDVVSNKYSRGKLVAIGGSDSYPGAIALAACAAQRMGAGYVEVFCESKSLPVVRASSLSLVARSWDKFALLSSLFDEPSEERPQACLIGSGFAGDSDEERELFMRVMDGCTHPVLIDGGALGYLASWMQGRSNHDISSSRLHYGGPSKLVLTPHFGEAKKLSIAAGVPVPEAANAPEKIEAIDSSYARCIALWSHALACAYDATVVLKGPDTFISDPKRNTVEVMRLGGPSLSKAGTGDVLAGMAASLLAQRMDAVKACVLASSLHAQSGNIASRSLSEICVCAEDIICFLPEMIVSLSDRIE